MIESEGERKNAGRGDSMASGKRDRAGAVISGYFNDDGTEVNPDLVPKPGRCLACKKDDAGEEETLCTLTRNDQKGGKTFECGAYEPKP